jgi:hypothetical protein
MGSTGEPVLRDRICAERGLLRGRFIAILTGVYRHAIYSWPLPFETVHSTKFFSWAGLRTFMGPSGCHALGLPETAIQALEKALAMTAAGDVVFVQKWEYCNHQNPNNPALNCTKRIGHASHHHHIGPDGAGPMWGPAPAALRAISQRDAKRDRAKATRLIEAAKAPHQLEPDLPDAAYPGLPHLHPLSVYLGNPIKMNAERLVLLPEYSRRAPSPPIIKNRPWKANRNVLLRDAPPEWWLGEYVEVQGQVAIRWSKILDKVERADVILPKPGQVNDSVTPADFDDEKKSPPAVVPEPPAPPPVVTPMYVAPPAPGSVLYCNIDECKHSVDWHDEHGCSFARGTVAACSCSQAAPGWALDERKEKEVKQANG